MPRFLKSVCLTASAGQPHVAILRDQVVPIWHVVTLEPSSTVTPQPVFVG